MCLQYQGGSSGGGGNVMEDKNVSEGETVGGVDGDDAADTLSELRDEDEDSVSPVKSYQSIKNTKIFLPYVTALLIRVPSAKTNSYSFKSNCLLVTCPCNLHRDHNICCSSFT